MNPSISFIFVNFRSAKLIQSSLAVLRASLDGQVTAEYLIINNDPDEKEAIDQIGRQVSDIRIVHMEQNRGFGTANNLGGNLATGEVLFFINPDTLLIQANFLGLLAAFRYRPKAIYGMALVQASGEREQWSAGLFPSFGRVLLAHMFPGLLPQPWRTAVVLKTDWVSGAACAIRRDFFRAVGGFDEAFFLYFEDVDLARRATTAGGWVGVYPFITLQHTGGQSHTDDHAKKEAYYTGQRRYFRKWRPWYEQVLLMLGHPFRHFF